MHSLKTLAASVILASFAAVSAQADVIVGPAATEGSTDNAWPFNTFAQRYEQLYAASNFGVSPIVISGLQFRPDANFGSAFSATLSNIDVKLGIVTPNALVSDFGANEAALMTTAHSGPLSISSAFTGPTGGPKDFDISINFTTTFYYDPSLGNLLLEVQNYGGGATTQFDAFFGDPNTRDYNIDGNAAGTSGVTDNINLVTKFVTSSATPVPEPTTLTLFAVGLVGAKGLRRSRKSS